MFFLSHKTAISVLLTANVPSDVFTELITFRLVRWTYSDALIVEFRVRSNAIIRNFDIWCILHKSRYTSFLEISSLQILIDLFHFLNDDSAKAPVIFTFQFLHIDVPPLTTQFHIGADSEKSCLSDSRDRERIDAMRSVSRKFNYNF